MSTASQPDDLGAETPVPAADLLEPTPTVEILVTTPVPDPTAEPAATALAARAAGDSSPAGWAWFLVGGVLGGLVGRASWGFRRKAKQQIFG